MKTKEEIEQLAESEYGTEIESIRGSNPYDLEKDRKNGFIKGYTQCQEDMADKKYTEEDLLHAFREGVLLPNSQIGIMEDIFKQVVHSINKQ
jgi:hypothetical protein